MRETWDRLRAGAEEATHGMEDSTVIAIDGPAGAGKSTVARLLAQRLGYCVLASGALYRAFALHVLESGVSPQANDVPEHALKSIDLRVDCSSAHGMKLALNGREIGEKLKDEFIGKTASQWSALPAVRALLLELQRNAARGAKVVAEGRDMGTVVFPAAVKKFFVTASLQERARRRCQELLANGVEADPNVVEQEMRARDERDSSRVTAPLTIAPDAEIVDTTSLTAAEVVDGMIHRLREAGIIGTELPETEAQ
jgi:cytidylate kinase